MVMEGEVEHVVGQISGVEPGATRPSPSACRARARTGRGTRTPGAPRAPVAAPAADDRSDGRGGRRGSSSAAARPARPRARSGTRCGAPSTRRASRTRTRRLRSSHTSGIRWSLQASTPEDQTAGREDERRRCRVRTREPVERRRRKDRRRCPKLLGFAHRRGIDVHDPTARIASVSASNAAKNQSTRTWRGREANRSRAWRFKSFRHRSPPRLRLA